MKLLGVLPSLICLVMCITCTGTRKHVSLAELDLMEFRTIAWNSLSEQQKEEIAQFPLDWKESEVELIWFSKKHQDAVKVTFETGNPILGPIGVYVDPYKKKVLGYTGRL